jgi:predicted secreted protein
MGKTILTTFPDADGIEDVLMRNWISDLDHPGSPGPTLAPTLFHFSLFGRRPSRIAMSDMTIEVTDLHPAFGSKRAEWFTDALLAIITVEGVRVSTDFDRLELRGVTGDFGLGGNALYGIEMWGELSFWPSFGTLKPMTGDHTVRRSVFDGLRSAGYDAEGMVNSRVMIRENRAVNSTWQSFLVTTMKASTVHVSHNVIELSGDYAYGMWLELLDGALINRNRISGAGAIGIYAGSGRRYRILNNDLDDLTVPADSYGTALPSGFVRPQGS